MVLQDKEGSRWGANQTQIPPMSPWRHAEDVCIHLRKPYLTQNIINMIPGIDKSSAKPTPAANANVVHTYGHTNTTTVT